MPEDSRTYEPDIEEEYAWDADNGLPEELDSDDEGDWSLTS